MVLYFSVFHKNSDGQYEVNFPDLEPYAATFGDTLEEALKSAHDALTGYLLTEEDYNEKVPSPTTDPAKFDVKSPNFIVPIEVNLSLERQKEQNKLVKKTLSIPKYLNDLGIENQINFSQTLTTALKNELNI